jgi:hypothetical protein
MVSPSARRLAYTMSLMDKVRAQGSALSNAEILASLVGPGEPKLLEDCTNPWLEAAIAWEVCASIHEKYAKGKDALYTTRHKDFIDAAQRYRALAKEVSHANKDRGSR